MVSTEPLTVIRGEVATSKVSTSELSALFLSVMLPVPFWMPSLKVVARLA